MPRRQVIEHQQRARRHIVQHAARRCSAGSAAAAARSSAPHRRRCSPPGRPPAAHWPNAGGGSGASVSAARRPSSSPRRHAGIGRSSRADVKSACRRAAPPGIAEADERIARQPLAALDALQQEARLERRELANADTGVSRSAAMSNGGFIDKKPIPECSGDGFWCDPNLWVVITACSNAQHPLLGRGATTSAWRRRNWGH